MSFRYKGRPCLERKSSKNNAWALDELLSDEEVEEIVKKHKLKKTKKDVCEKLEELSKKEKKRSQKKKESKNEQREQKDKYTESQLKNYKVDELKHILKKMGLRTSGRKEELIKNILSGQKGEFDINDCEKFTIAYLKNLLSKINLPISGNKIVLCERLREYYGRPKKEEIRNKLNKKESEGQQKKEGNTSKNVVLQKCEIYDTCPKGYTRKDLVSLATECGVKVKEGKKTLTMKEICKKLLDKYKKSDSNDKKSNLNNEEKEKILKEIDKYINRINDPQKDRFLEAIYFLNYITKEDVVNKINNKDFTDTLKKIVTELIDEYSFLPKVYEDLFKEKYNRKCKNESTFVLMTDVDDIPEEKYIKLSNGYCYDVDELMEALILSKDENINPSDPTRKTKLWRDEDEKEKIILHSGVDKDLKKRYNSMLQLKEEDDKKILKEIAKDTRILDKIAETGFKCMNDNITSFDEGNPESFIDAQQSLEELRDYINSSNKKIFYQNMYVGGFLRLETVLDSVHTECIHGIGMKLMTIYVTWHSRIKKIDSSIKLSKYLLKVSDDKTLYLTVGIVFNEKDRSYVNNFLVRAIHADNPIAEPVVTFTATSSRPKTFRDYEIDNNHEIVYKYIYVIEKYKEDIINHFTSVVYSD